MQIPHRARRGLRRHCALVSRPPDKGAAELFLSDHEKRWIRGSSLSGVIEKAKKLGWIKPSDAVEIIIGTRGHDWDYRDKAAD